MTGNNSGVSKRGKGASEVYCYSETGIVGTRSGRACYPQST